VKLVSIITPCYNEEANVEELYRRVRTIMLSLDRYDYEHIFIDNASTDRTVEILKQFASKDHRLRIIVNARNFGHVRSPMHALFEARGDAMIGVVSDLQDPPEMIPLLIAGWEEGNSMVLAIKRTSQEQSTMDWLRRRYYRFVSVFSATETFENYNGFGLYDRRVIEICRLLDDPYPYFRGMIADIGLPFKIVFYDQPVRRRGVTKNNFYTLYDLGTLGLINHSKVPLRIMVFAGFAGAILAFMVGAIYSVYKALYWSSFSLGIAPLVIGNFFIFSVQLLFLGVIGEYVGAIHTQVQKRPLVIERERVNFEPMPAPGPLNADYVPAEYVRSTVTQHTEASPR
jgi:glycosyltransferase involved in cell wall biosynthesis